MLMPSFHHKTVHDSSIALFPSQVLHKTSLFLSFAQHVRHSIEFFVHKTTLLVLLLLSLTHFNLLLLLVLVFVNAAIIVILQL
jgi:hypothetical protein